MYTMDMKYYCFLLFFSFLCMAINGSFIFDLFIHYISVREKLFYKILLFCIFAGSSAMVIWVGDHNLILTFPVFVIICMLCTKGNKYGRLAIIFIFFCIEMTVCAFVDTYIARPWRPWEHYDILMRIERPIIYGIIYVLFKRKLPKKVVSLSERLWKIIFGLSAMPVSTLLATVTLTYALYYSDEVNQLAMNLGLIILPFTFLNSFVILVVVNSLEKHEQLEKAQQLFEMRESYYQNLKQNENGLRHLRHDMRNHLFTIQTLLIGKNEEQALSYLEELLNSSALQGYKRFCENETANAVLQAKVDMILQSELEYDFRIEIPKKISIADLDLCSLLGNALDNAIEASISSQDKKISMRCRCDKGGFMLKLMNHFSGDIDTELKTTKSNKEYHGFGLSSMREIVTRYGGYLETNVSNNMFELIVYLPL